MAVVPFNKTPSHLEDHAKLVAEESPESVRINPDMVALLRDTLLLAEKGLVDAIVITGVLTNGDMYRGWTMTRDTSNPYKLIGVIESTKMEFALATAAIGGTYLGDDEDD